MAEIIISYKAYTTRFPRFTEQEFYSLKEIKNGLIKFGIFRIKNRKDFLYEFFKEFKYAFGSMLFLGFIIEFFDRSHPCIILFIPLVLWLALGGIVSIINFTDDFNSSKKYCRRLHKNFLNFENYDQYLFFHKFESVKL